MLMIKKTSEPRFKTVFYKDVELFTYRDASKKPVQLRLYDALSGWIVAAGMTKAEARYQGITNPIQGKNEEELIQILENKLTGHDLKGESFRSLITRRRADNPPKEEQQTILKAYVAATAASRSGASKTGQALIKAPVIGLILLVNFSLVLRVMVPRPTHWAKFTEKEQEFWVRRGLPVKWAVSIREFDRSCKAKLLVAFTEIWPWC